MFRGLGSGDPKGPRLRLSTGRPAQKQRGSEGSTNTEALCVPRGFSCHAICCSYVTIVALVISRLSCFVTDNAPRDAFVAAPPTSLSFSLFLFRKKREYRSETRDIIARIPQDTFCCPRIRNRPSEYKRSSVTRSLLAQHAWRVLVYF